VNTNIISLHWGDSFRFSLHGPDYVLAACRPHPDIPDLYNVTVEGRDDSLTMPEETPVIVTHAPRTATVNCLLCREDFTVDCDLAIEGLPRTGVCGPCNHKTSVAVIGERY
jgi:hypothetical protein